MAHPRPGLVAPAHGRYPGTPMKLMQYAHRWISILYPRADAHDLFMGKSFPRGKALGSENYFLEVELTDPSRALAGGFVVTAWHPEGSSARRWGPFALGLSWALQPPPHAVVGCAAAGRTIGVKEVRQRKGAKGKGLTESSVSPYDFGSGGQI